MAREVKMAGDIPRPEELMKIVSDYILATNDEIKELERQVYLLEESKVAKLLNKAIENADYWRDKYMELSGCGEISPTEIEP
jgi:hypothetical protein